MSCVAIGAGAVVAAGAITGAVISSNGAKSAAQQQANAASAAAQLQYDEFEQQQQNEQPWLQAGQSALSAMQSPNFQKTFSATDFQEDPGYQFNLQQGQNAIQASAAAQGGLLNGNTLTALTNYTQGQASNEYQNAYNRFNQNQTNQFNRLASIAGMGQTGTGQLNQAGENMANNVGNIGMSNANAQGAAAIAQGNAWGGAISGIGNGIGNNLMNMSMMSKYGNPYAGNYGIPTGATDYSMAQVPSSSGYTMPTLGAEFGDM